MFCRVRGSAMKEKKRTIYFIFTDTGTYLSKIINYFTKKSLNHVSIGIDKDLMTVYSFGRKTPRNPFNGGFVKEDIRGVFLKDSRCAIYRFYITEMEFRRILHNIKQIERKKSYYKYNFLGLIGVLFKIEMNRKNALFCSQFVATVMKGATESFNIEKPTCFITPADIREHNGMTLLYEGRLGDFKKGGIQIERKLTNESKAVTKQSILLATTEKVKEFVIRYKES